MAKLSYLLDTTYSLSVRPQRTAVRIKNLTPPNPLLSRVYSAFSAAESSRFDAASKLQARVRGQQARSKKSLLASSALCESTERSQAAAMLQARVRGTKARKGYVARKGW